MAGQTSSAKHSRQHQIARCIHCETELAGKGEFCCAGCKAAYNILQNNSTGNLSDVVFSPFATTLDNGDFHITLSIKGVHCASCIQLIENALYANEHVISARVNMSTERLNISWKGSQEHADALAFIVTELGYVLKPFSDEPSEKKNNSEKALLIRIAVAGFASANLMVISVGLWSSSAETMGISTRDFFHWASALIALPTIIYAGLPFFSSALAVLKQKHTNMDVPISLAVILASFMSILETIKHGEHIYFDSAVMLLFFLLIGRYLDARAKGKAKGYAQELLSMLHGMAHVVENGKTVTMPIRDLRENMIVLVAVGDNIPADGVVSKGDSELDMSLITGETIPQHIKNGDTVFAGTVNLNSPIEITISKASDDSLLSDIVKLMEKAEQGQAHYVRLADKAATLYTPVVHFLGLITFLGWWILAAQPWQPSLLVAITVLIITCPCALGLAVPVVQVLASSRLMKNGILLKSGDALERLASIDTIVLDKTGTLTLGTPELLAGDYNNKDLQLAASIAVHSRHPLSQALCRAFSGEALSVNNVQELNGKGLQAEENNAVIKLGNAVWCNVTPTSHHTHQELWLVREKTPPVCFTFADTLRDNAAAMIEQFKKANITPILLSGDHQLAVEDVANKVGITNYHAAYSPIEKCNFIKELQSKGHHVLMVGDGLNDAPSLATADVSISPSTAIDITQNTADVIFQSKGLSSISEVWQVAKTSNKLVKQNFMLAIAYNIIAIPLAMLGFVTPLIAAIAMSSSSLLVVVNSYRIIAKKDI